MKLSSILASVNQMEKSKFINYLDKVCTDACENDPAIAKRLDALDGQIKNASSAEIVQIFNLVQVYFEQSIKDSLSMLGAQADLLTKILSRDGNCVARTSWLETLYASELDEINQLSNDARIALDGTGDIDMEFESYKVDIYHACFEEAYRNDERSNRQCKITDDEKSVLNVLANKLGIPSDLKAAIENIVSPIPSSGTIDCLNALRETGVIFIRRKDQTVFIADEVVSLLNKIQGKHLADKHLLRILRTLNDSELNNVLKKLGKKTRGVERTKKIRVILHTTPCAENLLRDFLHNENSSTNERKDRLKTLMADLEIEPGRLGSTLDERIELIIGSLNSVTASEMNALSATGYKDLFAALKNNLPSFENTILDEFEIENNEPLDIERLKSLSITPHDILFTIPNEDVKSIRDAMKLSKRGDARKVILENFANATDKLIELYNELAHRDLAALKNAGIDIQEPDIGVRFEEATKVIFEQLGLHVDEDARKEINSAKDKADILISLSEDDVIIGEAKTCKSGDFAKYSSTSRQVKSYVNRYEEFGKRVAQVLIIAPSFSDDFVESAEMDTEVNISMLEARGLLQIYNAFKSKRAPKFSAKLFTKGGLLKADLIAKNI